NGNQHPSVTPSQSFVCADGWVMLAAGNDSQFEKLCHALEAPHLAKDERFRTNAARLRHAQDLTVLVEAITRTRPAKWWMDKLSEQGVPCGKVQDIAQAFADPQVRHRGIHVELTGADHAPVPVVASPLRLSASPVHYELPPPRLGEHTDQVLGDVLGLVTLEIGALRASGVI
ncbi:MAG: CoA transferase, partial [Betaproteobacteria bacterium]|nr:CoA transferase [Betaproteobacteria bacterium]